MTTSAALSVAQVTKIDIRDRGNIEADVIVARALTGRVGMANRLLVLLDTDQLQEQHDLLVRLRGTSNLIGLIVVAVGPAIDRGLGVARTRIAALTGSGVLTIWISDVVGVPWRIGAPTDEALVGGDGAFDRLIDALSAPEIFNHVIAQAIEIKNQLASPGVRAIVGQVNTDILMAVHGRVVAALATGPELTLPLGKDEPLVGRLASLPNPIHDSSRLGIARSQAFGAITDAERVVAQVPGFHSVIGGQAAAAAWQALDTANQAILGFGHVVRSELEVNSAADNGARARLEQAGVNFATLPDLDRASIEARTKPLVESALAHMSLRSLATQLRLVRDNASPQGTQRYRDHVDSTLRSFAADSAPPSYLVNPVRLPAALFVAVCCFLAALGSGWQCLITGAVAAVMWPLLTFLLVRNRPADPAKRWSSGAVFEMFGQTLLAWVCVVAGWYVDTRYSVPPAVAGVAVVIALVAGLPFAAWWIRSSGVRRWASKIGFERMARTTEEINRALREAATLEWVLGESRRFYTRLAGSVATLCGAMADAGADYVKENGTLANIDAVETQPGGRLYKAISRDVMDAVTEVVDGNWALLKSGSADGLRESGYNEFAVLLAEHRSHLLAYNVHKRPRFAHTPVVVDGEDIGQVWTADGQINDVLATMPQNLMRQLCDEHDLSLLDPTLSRTVMVRFAPTSAKSALRTADASTLWTEGGFVAGAIRLVEIRATAVRDFIPVARDGRDD